MNSEEIKTEINFIASKVNQFILDNVSGNPSNLYDASLHYIKSGGKRLRPFMTAKSCQLIGGSINNSLPAAAAIELIHNFTLVHDDIMDNDRVRHNVATVHEQYGIPVAILSGDILFSKAFHIIAFNGKKQGIDSERIVKMVDILSSSCIDVCEGQCLDIEMSSDKQFSSQENYIKMIEKKTAALFKSSCELGALSSPNFIESDFENLSSYGKKIGTAFQLIDDLIGIYGDTKVTGKFVGNDIREGKKTLPVLLAFKNLDPLNRDKLEAIFGDKNAEDESIKAIIDQIAKLGIDKDVKLIAKTYVDDAFEILKKYDITEPRMSLEKSALYIIERSF